MRDNPLEWKNDFQFNYGLARSIRSLVYVISYILIHSWHIIILPHSDIYLRGTTKVKENRGTQYDKK